MSTIPASDLVSVIPSVIGAGGSALTLQGLILTNSTRVPIGSVLSFPSASEVDDYFGAASVEALIAADYFLGFTNSSVRPGSILFAQYNQAAVAAYIRGGDISALTLPQLQALSGSLTLTVDGYVRTAASVILSSATSFSSAAALIQTALDASEPTEASVTASIAPNTFTGSIAGNLLTVTAVGAGSVLSALQTIAGAGVTVGTKIISQASGTAGGIGTYLLTGGQVVASEAMTATGGGLTVTVVGSGALAVGNVLTGAGVTAGTMVSALGTGTGGVGTYAVSISQTVASEAITAVTAPVVVTYDSVSGGFNIASGVVGATSTMSVATGTLAAGIKLTTATGAVLSQGVAAASPAAFMDAIIAQTTNWATFMTSFDPDLLDTSGNTVKQAFAAWNNAQGNQFAYVVWDTDITPTVSNNATTCLGQILKGLSNSGTVLVYAPDYHLAAFACGAIAAINFIARNGRITLAFKNLAGLAVTVTNRTVSRNLIANGYNFYAPYATANDQFILFYPGQITGPFAWIDAYVNQIWLNSAFQLALLSLLTQVNSVPYAPPGYALLRSACMDPILAALNFGAIQPGVPLSEAQKAEVNTQAGTPIDSILSTQGWFLQILPATAQSRAARTTPPMTFWYMDGGAVQQISLNSVEVQ